MLAALLLCGAGVRDASAWGCDGHQAVAIIAERLLGTATLSAVTRVLSAAPVDRTLNRFCGADPDLMADVSTWADDQRSVDSSTAGWHFINFPRVLGSQAPDYRRFCARGTCAVDAIVTQYRALTTSTDPKARADALRFLIHLIGDLHQPLHAITNGDRGGNCLAIAVPGEPVREQANHNVTPNLHRVWDADMLERFMAARHLRDARALATHIMMSGAARPITAQAPTAATVASWARGSNELAQTAAYGRLPVPVPLQPATAITLSSCDDNNHVGRRFMSLNERLTPAYEQANAPVILSQLRLAGERLAAVLKAAFAAA